MANRHGDVLVRTRDCLRQRDDRGLARDQGARSARPEGDTCLGVLNTWGAKGVFDLRSGHHLATGGLQRADFCLAGLGDTELVVCLGVDRAVALDAPRTARALHVDPAQIGPLSELWKHSARELPVVPLRRRLAEVVQGAWALGDRDVLHPAKAVQHISEGIGPRGSVAADPGPAGFWLARSFVTRRVGDASIPARPGRRDGLRHALSWTGSPTRRLGLLRSWTSVARTSPSSCAKRGSATAWGFPSGSERKGRGPPWTSTRGSSRSSFQGNAT